MRDDILGAPRFRSAWLAVVVAIGLLALLAALLAVVLWVMARPATTVPGQERGPITMSGSGRRAGEVLPALAAMPLLAVELRNS